ncbi:hypothetical protein, partial [Dryocola boscaweniae]|uniref:hypothetical protein n=1 Tax=Dryocola boscaweniae TaxID=2925397 RepID=UPI0022F00ED1
TQVGDTASITSLDSLSLLAGSNINITGANLAAGGDLLMKAWGISPLPQTRLLKATASPASGAKTQPAKNL